MFREELENIHELLRGSQTRISLEEWFESALDAEGGGIATFVNPHFFYLNRFGSGYLRALRKFDQVRIDGWGLVVLARRIRGSNVERVSFDSTSIANFVFEKCSYRETPVALVGGHPGVAERAGSVLQKKYPGLHVAFCSHGYHKDWVHLADEIVRTPSRVVICGMGAPRQEEFLLHLKKRGWAGVGFTCGGYLDQLGSGFYYYPKWVDKLNLRFVYRFLLEPRRIGRRIFIEYIPFLRVLGEVYFKFGRNKNGRSR